MPRLRRSVPVGGVVPVELLDRDGVTWATVAATGRWLELHRLPTSERVSWGPASRFIWAADAWAFANGWTREYQWRAGVLVVDRGRMHEAGVAHGDTGERNMELLTAAGVTIRAAQGL